jgi:hypothetical protein
MVELEPVDAVEVTLVVDNFDDILLAGDEGVQRFPLAYDLFDHQQLVAERGSRPWSPWSRAGGAARSRTTAA